MLHNFDRYSWSFVTNTLQAIRAYSSAILTGTEMPELRIRCHANRAHAHLERRNYGYAFQDSMQAVNISEKVLRADHASGAQGCTCKHDPEYEASPTCTAGASQHGWIKGVMKKCLGRAAKACVSLEKWLEAIALCDRGLGIEVGFGDDTLRKLRAQARQGHEVEMQMRRRKEEEEERKKLKMITVKV